MRTVKVATSDLLGKLKVNRGEHRAVFERALEGYRKAAIEELEKMLAEAKANKRVRRSLTLVEPVDQTRDYDRAIGMLEMHTEQMIDISESEYSQYVMDDWSWKHQFNMTNSVYLEQ